MSRWMLPPFLSLFFFTACTPPPPPAAPQVQPPEKIPITQFFDNPKISSAHISPDGKRLAFLAPEGGRLNIWVMNVGQKPEEGTVLTHDIKRGIFSFFWSWNSKYVIYEQDQGGNENFHLYQVTPDQPTEAAVDLTPFAGVRAEILDLPREKPDEVLVELNKRDKRYFDVYRLFLHSGKLTLVEKNPGDVDGWVTDTKSVVRACNAKVVGGLTEIRVRDGATGPFHVLGRYQDEDDANIEAFTKEGDAVYFSTAQHSNTTQLVKLNLKTKEETLVAEDQDYDLESVIISDLTHDLIGVSFNRDKLTYQPFDAQFARDLDILGRVHDGEILFRSSDATEQKWIIAYNSPTDPGATYLYDRATGVAQFLYRPRPWLKPENLVDMKPIRFQSRDGLKIEGYLSVPKGVLAKNLPLVLIVHGGPWARDDWGYDPEAQFLANRGYAVLQVNYRGSTGYGKKFLHAGDKEWGGKMLDDLIDGVNWAVSEGIADPKRLGIYGGSYGGYATLAALAFRPGVFSCGVDYVGISNLLTFMNTIPPYWDTFRDIMYKRVGNPKTETDFLRSRSPLYSADKINVPLFIAQGFNDPRVNVAEAEQIKKALEARGQTVEYLLKMDEGHGFANPENRIDLYSKMEIFLDKYLK